MGRNEWARNYNNKYPEKALARSRVHDALKADKLRKGPCEKCGCLKVHAHHDDYSKPLEVRWLCHTCHEKHHHPDGPKKVDYSIYYKYAKKPKELWEPRPTPQKNKYFEVVKDLRERKYTYKAISEITGVSEAKLYRWMRNSPD